MSTDSTNDRGDLAWPRDLGPSPTLRFADVIYDDGHAWVLARDNETWFYECLRCGDRAHVLTRAEMAEAVKHSYAYMPLNHRAPWKTKDHAPCARPDAPVDTGPLERGPLVAVSRDDESASDLPAGDLPPSE